MGNGESNKAADDDPKQLCLRPAVRSFLFGLFPAKFAAFE